PPTKPPEPGPCEAGCIVQIPCCTFTRREDAQTKPYQRLCQSLRKGLQGRRRRGWRVAVQGVSGWIIEFARGAEARRFGSEFSRCCRQRRCQVRRSPAGCRLQRTRSPT